jgi:hypothetical protein
MVLAGYATTDCGPTVTATPQLMSLSNPATAGTPLLNAPVSVPANIEQLVTSVGGPLTATGAPVSFSTSGPTGGAAPPTSFGVDAVVNQQQSQPATLSPSTAIQP